MLAVSRQSDSRAAWRLFLLLSCCGLLPGVRTDAHAIPELPLASRAATEVDRFALGANVLVLHAALELSAALFAVGIVAGGGGLLVGFLLVHTNSFAAGVRPHA